MIDRLDVPASLNRNAAQVIAAGYEHTGQILIDLATRSAGFKGLDQVDVLDVGCGLRFTQTLINRKIPIKSYTGIDVDKAVVQFLKKNVEAKDARFHFAHWNVHNQMYNPKGVKLSKNRELPVEGTFDLIWLFSVFTHMNPEDSLALLQSLRTRIRDHGKLFFSTFIDDKLEGFDDRDKKTPLLMAYYGRNYMRSLVEQAGWNIDLFHDKDEASYIQHYLVCSPKPSIA